MPPETTSNIELQYLIILFSLVFFVLILTIVSLINYFRKKKTEFILERERRASEFEQNLMIAKDEIIEQNLKNLSWELHDNIGQLLSVASIELNMVRDKFEKDKKDLDDVSSLISKSLREIRSLSKVLNSDFIIDRGLERSLVLELERLNRLGVIKTSLDIDDNVIFSEKIEIIVFRMLQEFINNTIKHAQASNLKISIMQKGSSTIISASDDGIGFIVNEDSLGSGLLHLKGRAKMIGADFGYNSEIGRGTKMTILLR